MATHFKEMEMTDEVRGVDALAVLRRVSQQVADLSGYAERRSDKNCCEDAAEAMASSEPWPDLDRAAALLGVLVDRCAGVVRSFEDLGRSDNTIAQLECRRECEHSLVELKSALIRCTGGAE